MGLSWHIWSFLGEGGGCQKAELGLSGWGCPSALCISCLRIKGQVKSTHQPGAQLPSPTHLRRTGACRNMCSQLIVVTPGASQGPACSKCRAGGLAGGGEWTLVSLNIVSEPCTSFVPTQQHALHSWHASARWEEGISYGPCAPLLQLCRPLLQPPSLLRPNQVSSFQPKLSISLFWT